MADRVLVREPCESDPLVLGGVWFRAERSSLEDGYSEGFPSEWFWMESVEQAEENWALGFLTEQVGVRSWVGEVGGRPVGFAQAGPAAEGPLGCLRSLYVDPGVWGSGVGSALHDVAIAFLREGFDQAELWVVEGNRKTRKFYERRGWVDGDGSMLVGNGLPLVRYVRALV